MVWWYQFVCCFPAQADGMDTLNALLDWRVMLRYSFSHRQGYMRKGFFPSLLALLACASADLLSLRLVRRRLLSGAGPGVAGRELVRSGTRTAWATGLGAYRIFELGSSAVDRRAGDTTVGDPTARRFLGDPNTRVLFANAPVDFGTLRRACEHGVLARRRAGASRRAASSWAKR
jgi:hypothetical protein